MKSKVPLILVLLAVPILLWWMLGRSDDVVEPNQETGPASATSQADQPRASDDPASLQPGDVTALDLPPGFVDVDPPEIDLPFDDVPFAVGMVEYMDGSPAPDMEVALFDDLGEYLTSTFSEDDGSFVLEWDEGLAPGWSVATEAPFFAEEDAPNAVVPASYTHDRAFAPGDTPLSLTLVLTPAPRIEGRVIDAVTGGPVDFAEVYAVCTRAEWQSEYQSVWTDDSGHYAMTVTDLPADSLLIWCEGDDQQPGAVGPIDLQPGEVRILDFVLNEVQILEGIVVSAQDGTPIDGAEVSLLPLHPEFVDDEAWDISWDDGSFEIEIVATPSQFVEVLVTADDYRPTVVRPTDLDAQLRIELHPPAKLTGTVTDDDTDEPIAGAEVILQMHSATGMPFEDGMDEADTGSDGRYVIELEWAAAVPESTVIVRADGYRPHRVRLGDRIIDLSSSVITVDVRLIPR